MSSESWPTIYRAISGVTPMERSMVTAVALKLWKLFSARVLLFPRPFWSCRTINPCLRNSSVNSHESLLELPACECLMTAIGKTYSLIFSSCRLCRISFNCLRRACSFSFSFFSRSWRFGFLPNRFDPISA